ncbi:MAG: hypothetical protein O3C40_16110 [Planctomycetota bacterium]|nr:hypothetical protein [Planctomycetota bacterium]
MKLSPWQFDHNPWYGWSISAILHLGLVIAVSLLLMPSGDATSELLEVEVTFEDIGADLVALDSFTAELDSLDADVADAAAIFEQNDALEIMSPSEALAIGNAAGSGGDGSSTAGRHGHSGGAGQTSFFGTVARGNSFVYVLDVSPSMNARRGERLERAVLELLQSLDQLNEKQRFYVIVFGWGTRRMFDSEQLYPSPIPATLGNKQRLRDWLAQVQTIPGTDPRKALEIGLALQPSAIFFLSDGEFNKPDRGKFFSDDTAEAEDVINAGEPTAIPIHTVAFEDRSCEARMNGIATLTNGQHRFVPAPPGSTSTSSAPQVSKEFARTVSGFAFSDEPARLLGDTSLAGSIDVAIEARALYRLQLAKMLENTAKPAMARRYYERVAQEFPDTQAAKEALASLRQLVDSSE